MLEHEVKSTRIDRIALHETTHPLQQITNKWIIYKLVIDAVLYKTHILASAMTGLGGSRRLEQRRDESVHSKKKMI